MAKGECIEELCWKLNSNISESERSIIDQSIQVQAKTETTGYKLSIPQSRVVLDTTACFFVRFTKKGSFRCLFNTVK